MAEEITLDQYVLSPSDNTKWLGDPNVSITGTGFSVPRGVEAILSYNGIAMNDLTVYDKYRVMGIDGLSDPDIRDSREDKFSDDGEDAYDSYYGGRTIVLKIRVEAYQLDKLRDMEEALRTAFASLTEKKLTFVTGDPEKDHYIMCKKSQSMSNTEDIESINYRHFRDWQITLRASDPRFYRSKKKSKSSTIVGGVPEELNVINIGNYSSFPKIKLFGPMENISLYNDQAPEPFNGIIFNAAYALGEGEFLVIDSERRTITDDTGASQISQLDKASGWLKVSPGANLFYFGGSTDFSGISDPQIYFEWRDSWI
jgi:phage-related protein